MSKTKEETAVAKANETVTKVEVNGKVLNVEETLAAIEGMQEGDNIVNNYFTLEPGETARVVFTGMAKMKGMGANSGQDIDAVKFIAKDDDGKFNKICADKVLVSACKDLPAPTALSITCVGVLKPKSGLGSYKDYEVRKLN